MFFTDWEEQEEFAEIRRRQLGIAEEMNSPINYESKYNELKTLLKEYLTHGSSDGKMVRQELRKQLAAAIE